DAALPREYLEIGLRTMYELSKYAQKRKQVVLALAQRIADAIQAVQLPPGDPIPNFEFIASALHKPQAGVRYAVAVVPLLANKADEVMFGAKPVREPIETACGLSVAHYLVEQDGQLEERLRLARDHHQVVVVVTTLSVLVDPI